VTAHVLGEKVIVGKHKRRTGYRRRNGHRSRLSRIEIQTIGNTRGRSPLSTPQKESKAPAAKMSTTTAKKSTTTTKKEEAE